MKSACILAFLTCLIASSFAQLDSSNTTQAGSPEFNSTCIQFGQLLGSSKPPQGIQMNNSLVCLVMMVREPTVTVDKVLSSSPLTRGVAFSFQFLSNGTSLCFAEVAIFDSEIPLVTYSIASSYNSSNSTMQTGNETVSGQNQTSSGETGLNQTSPGIPSNQTTYENTPLRIAALHNHWLNTSPQLWFIHWQMVGDPLFFAQASKQALDAARIVSMDPPAS